MWWLNQPCFWRNGNGNVFRHAIVAVFQKRPIHSMVGDSAPQSEPGSRRAWGPTRQWSSHSSGAVHIFFRFGLVRLLGSPINCGTSTSSATCGKILKRGKSEACVNPSPQCSGRPVCMPCSGVQAFSPLERAPPFREQRTSRHAVSDRGLRYPQ